MRRSIAILVLLCAAQPPARADQLPNPDPEIYGEDPPAPPVRVQSRVPDYIAASVTAGLAVAAAVSFYKMVVNTDTLQYEQPGVTYEVGDADGWKIATLAFGGAGVICGVVTGFLWARHHAPAMTVNANGQGGVVTFSGRF